jgi:hypothetical protein
VRYQVGRPLWPLPLLRSPAIVYAVLRNAFAELRRNRPMGVLAGSAETSVPLSPEPALEWPVCTRSRM